MLYALRTLRRSPAFAATAVLTLALAIGAATTVAGVVDRALLRPLPYPAADRLVTLLESDGAEGRRLVSYPTFVDWRAQSGASFADLAFVRGNTGTLRGADGPERLTIGYVSEGYFALVGARPLLGRTFGADEERTNAGNPIVLSHDFWQRRFGGDPDVVGRALTVDDALLTVIGVMPAGTGFPDWADSWRPLAAVRDRDPALAQRGLHVDSRAIGRLRPGVTPERAAAELAVVAQRVAAEHPADAAGWTAVALTPLRDEVVGNVAPMLLTLAAAVALGLLIACVNVANLSLVRAAARAREMAVRTALGAGRGRIVRQLLAESLVVALLAGAGGVLAAAWAVRALRAAAPVELPRAAELAVDGRVLGYALALSLLVAALCGLAPALRAAGTDVGSVLRSGRAAGMRGPGARRLQGALTVAQFGLALMLLIGAGLLVDSFRRVQAVDVGFVPRGVLTLAVLPPTPRYDEPAAVAALYERLIAAAAAVPGVQAAAIVNHAPLGGWMPTRVEVPGRQPDSTGADMALYKTASPDYLRALGVPLVRGRWFTAEDMAGAATGIVVNEVVARRYWPGQDPIGRPLTVYRSSQARADFGAPVHGQVIGVVGSVRHFGLESEPAPELFVPYTLEPWPHAVLAVRTALPPASVTPALRRAVLAVEPDLPVAGAGRGAGIQPLARALASSLAARRWSMGLMTGFAACALLLAALGIYGVTAYAVAQRTHEVGVRVALGATRGRVVAMVVRQGVLLALGGVAVGLGGAFVLTRLLDGLLFGTSPTEPAVFVALPAVLTAVAALASWLPARRAARVEPVVALRAE